MVPIGCAHTQLPKPSGSIGHSICQVRLLAHIAVSGQDREPKPLQYRAGSGHGLPSTGSSAGQTARPTAPPEPATPDVIELAPPEPPLIEPLPLTPTLFEPAWLELTAFAPALFELLAPELAALDEVCTLPPHAPRTEP